MSFDVWKLKRYVMRRYPPDHPIQVIQSEKDVIDDPKEWLAKVEIWLKLANLKR